MTYSQSKFLLYPGQVISEVWNQFTALNRGGKRTWIRVVCSRSTEPLSPLCNKSVSTKFQQMRSDSWKKMKENKNSSNVLEIFILTAFCVHFMTIVYKIKFACIFALSNNKFCVLFQIKVLHTHTYIVAPDDPKPTMRYNNFRGF